MSVANFVKTMLDRWPPYRWDETQERAYAEDLQRELSGFSADILERARRDMVRKRTKTQTPTVAECIGYAEEAKRWSEMERNKGQLIADPAKQPYHEWSTERVKLAYELIRTPLGKQAAQEGWILALWEFIRKNGRHPTSEREFSQCKASARGFDEAYAATVRGDAREIDGRMLPFNAVVQQACIRWGDSVLKRRERLAAEAMGTRQ